MNLNELKKEQNVLRDVLIAVCQRNAFSLLTLSKKIELPYTTFRSFMMGNNISFNNIFKIKKWLDLNDTYQIHH